MIDKTTFAEEDGELIKELDKKFGVNETVETIQKIFRLGTVHLTGRGITISVEDLDLEQDVIQLMK